jgi:transcriptional regulator with XRE-family HTH domain
MTFNEIITNLSWPKRLAVLRINKDLSQGEIAKQLGVHLDTYRRWESGEQYPSRVSRRLLAKYHNVSEIEIFGERNDG